jgi:Fe-S-cluster containining protein
LEAENGEKMGLLPVTERKIKGQQTSCMQCGICCTKGGAALHGEDLFLLRQGLIPRQDLITIRRGEFAYNPLTDKVQATKTEIVKLRGTGGEWTCCYYDPLTRSCSIYKNRPLACRALKCWDSQKSLALVETDLLSRLDILEEEELLQELVRTHNNTCPLPDFTSLPLTLQENTERTVTELETLINRDLRFRNKAVEESELVLKEELFLFGRPLFQLVQSFDLHVFQSGNCLRLQWERTT